MRQCCIVIAQAVWLLSVMISAAAAVPPSVKQTAYCDTFKENLTTPGADQLIAIVQSKCQPGDILQLPSSYTYALVKLCDFNRAIVVGESIVCVFAGQRPNR